MNHIVSIRKMRPLEPADSAGIAGAVSGLGAASGLADFFVGGKREFYQERSFKFRVSTKSRATTDLHGEHGSNEESLHKHAIPIRVEPIPLANCMLVGGEGAFAPGEGRHQHD